MSRCLQSYQDSPPDASANGPFGAILDDLAAPIDRHVHAINPAPKEISSNWVCMGWVCDRLGGLFMNFSSSVDTKRKYRRQDLQD